MHRARQRAPASAGIAGRRRAVLGRRQDVHGRQRRRAHGLDARGLEQEPPRTSDTGNKGYPATPPDAYRTDRRPTFHDAGIHVSTHAIGDRAIDWVVDTYAAGARSASRPRPPPRHHPRQHADRPRDRRDGAAADATSTRAIPRRTAAFVWWIGDNYAGNLGPGRATCA